MKNVLKLFSVLIAAGFLFTSCEGPMGPAGKDGKDGTDGLPGADANETCKECHNPEVVDAVAVQFELSKHNYGEAAFEEAGRKDCTPCHGSEAFKYVCAENKPSTFTLNTTTQKYENDYVATAATALGELNCSTCHSSLHTDYDKTDFSPLTSTAAVSMTMWKGDKSINIAQDGGKSNLCVKCHQPRPMTTSTSLADGNVIDYAALVSSPEVTYYDSTYGNAPPNKHLPSYRMHVHYGTVGAVFAGMGGIEFPGDLAYENSTHTTGASCQDCHMAAISGRAGGHTFNVKGNFNGCNAVGCHTGINDKNDTFWKTPRSQVKALLDELASKLNSIGDGTDILHSDTDAEENLWAGLTTGNYDGYLNIYDPSSNATGVWRNPAPGSTWTQANKDTNNDLPKFPSLLNVQMGAMINFQMCLREYSLGIHNTMYSKALLQNSIDALTEAGV